MGQDGLQTFSSAANRERDKALIAPYVSKIETLKKEWKIEEDKIRRELFDSRNQAGRLATLLGFKDTVEALMWVGDDKEKGRATYREALRENDMLKDDNQEIRSTLDEAKNQLRDVRVDLRREADEHRSTTLELSRTKAELTKLNNQYDDLLSKKERANERYKKDYKKYREFKQWLFDDGKVMKKVESMWKECASDEDKKTAFTNVWSGHLKSGRATIKDMNVTPPLWDKVGDKENISSSPTRVNTTPTATPTRAPLLNSSSPNTPVRILAPDSSPERPKFPSPSRGSPFKVPALPIGLSHASSDTEEETQAFKFPPILPASLTTTSRKSGNGAERQHIRRSPSGDSIEIDGPPRKIRRVSSPARLPQPAPAGSKPPIKKRPRASSPGPSRSIKVKGEDTENSTPLRSNGNTFDSRPWTTGKLKENVSVSSRPETRSSGTSAIKTSQGKPGKNKDQDYSIYKGRGRYGATSSTSTKDKTINTEFMINPTSNQGADYQYEEVVRKKDERRRLAGEDCDECRAYYDAIGPLPPRLQAPLWRSPTKSSEERSIPQPQCNHHDGVRSSKSAKAKAKEREKEDEDKAQRIADHRNGISRHRRQWERAKTPPDYWEIGFPNTQKVNDINDRAKVMHEEKMRNVGREADKDGGRWLRRR